MRVVYDQRHLLHDPGTEVQHGVPMPIYEVPARVESIRASLQADSDFTFTGPTDHGLGPVTAVHDEGLVRFLAESWSSWRRHGGGGVMPPQFLPDTVLHPALREGMGPAREPSAATGRIGYWCWETMTPLVVGSYQAALAAVDVALTAADLLLAGDSAVYGLARPPGHHCPRSAFGGYGLLNYSAAAAAYVAERAGRVAVLDVDYHHGNGTQQIFYQRADVLYVSLHADPDRAYPYFIGWADERGAGPGEGFTLNLPLPAGCTNDNYLAALDQALERIAEHNAAVLVVSLGLDTYGQDPIADFALSTDVYHEVGRRVASLGLPTLVLQEGGYFVAKLGENARTWLRGLLGSPLDLRAASHPARPAEPQRSQG
jgi:acetoin utilization deacetylase AcuC-like enzyme